MTSAPPPGPRGRTSIPPPVIPSSPTPATHADIGRRLTPQGAQEYFLRVVPSLEREIGELRQDLEQQRERNDNLSHAMGLLTAQLLGAYAEVERLRELVGRASVDDITREELRRSMPANAPSTDRIYKLFRALIELSPQEASEFLVRRREVHAILTGLRQVLLSDAKDDR